MSFWRIDPDSVVLLDYTVLVGAIVADAESMRPASEECTNLISRCAQGIPRGVITPRMVAQVWKRLALLAMINADEKLEPSFRRGVIRSRPDTIEGFDLRARIEGLVESELLLLNPDAADFAPAYDLLTTTNLDIGMAIDLVAAKRRFGEKLIVATLSRDYDTAEFRGFKVVKPEVPVLKAA